MIIGIDGNEANIKNRVGVGQYAFNLLKSIYSLDQKNQYIIYLKDQPLSDLPKVRQNWTYKIFGPKKLWTKFALPLHLFTEKAALNLFYSPSHYSPQFAPCPTIPTIHDLGYLQFKNQFTKKDFYQLTNWTEQSIKKSAHIVTVSNFSKTEIEKIYHINPERITIAYNGVEEPLKIDLRTQQKILSLYNLKPKDYYLYLGTLKPNKNIPFLIRAFAKFLKTKEITPRPVKGGVGGGFVPKLVIAGKKGWLFDEIFSTIKQENIESNVIFTDFIDDNQKTILYQNTKALIMPSTYEGFGIPVIEAMKLNTPVISSDIPPLKEVIENNGFYFNPTNQQELVNQLLKFEKLNPEELKKITDKAKSRADFFTWTNTAKSVLSVFDKFKN